ncbi:cuticle protein AMP1A-like [Macrobrachium rosenbergii]|uniref:cuticle protein AMP1A-like n=1 Tax=Macrobrachium rosenbergii TaxID=79674 RepID=UPI0034D7B0E1
MKFVIVVALVTVALADDAPPNPSPSYGAPAPSGRAAVDAALPLVATLRDARTQDEFGSFSVDFEADNGIVFSQSGSPSGPEDSVVKSGVYSYTAPDGTFVEVKYVADENGYQPESDLLPLAPEFPHPIPQFVLDQIAKAAEEDAAAAEREAASLRSNSYAPPSPPATGYGAPQ